MNSYNPQDWGMHGPAAGVHMRHARTSVLGNPRALEDMTGMEASLPSPPPPYFATPAGSTAPQPMSAASFRACPPPMSSGLPQDPSPTSLRSACSPTSGYGSVPGPPFHRSTAPSVNTTPHLPQQISPTTFPPPPSNPRDRSSSRARGVLNNFSAWTNRHKSPDDVPRTFSSGELFSQQWRDDTSPQATVQPFTNVHGPSDLPSAPPAARRAISVGYVVPPVLHSRETSRTRPVTMDPAPWEPGMPLPPPPPGPPPTTRSHSLGPIPSQSSNQPPVGPFTTPPRQPHRGTVLGSVPPTPADWVDEDERQPHTSQGIEEPDRPGPVGMLRLNIRRDGSTKGIRERRNESRARSRDPHADIGRSPQEFRSELDEAKPVDLVLSTNSNIINRRRNASKPSPSPRNLQLVVPSNESGGPGSDPTSGSGGFSSDAAFRWPPNPPITAVNRFMPTPPFSPESPDDPNGCVKGREPLARFLRLSLDRYRTLIEKERRAATDIERLRLFAGFIVRESKLHRERFPDAFDGIANDLMGTTSDMWLSDEPSAINSATSPEIGIYTEPQHNTPSPLSTRNLSETFKYEPVLSPVLSTTGSNLLDDVDARGRPASRWWEGSTPSSSVTGSVSRKIERSAGESKYMGVAYEEEQCQENTAPHTGVNGITWAQKKRSSDMNGSKHYQEYFDSNKTPTWPPRGATLMSPDASTPKPSKLDVSRLVTLPPPYPRRHPALSKSHPRLASERAGLRRISNKDLLSTIRAHRKSLATADDYSEARKWSTRLQAMIAEADDNLTLLELDTYAAENSSPSRAQEEGDAEPELLERLTLMKWLFEAREYLLREQSALGYAMRRVSDRDENDTSNISATSVARQSLRRYEVFSATIATLTTNGVQSLAAAFWDIAPDLSSLIHELLSYNNLPALSAALDIPPHEIASNSAHSAQPLRYLHEVLRHAESSTRQFIDGQINLLCLKHEVACAAEKARRKVVEAQQREQTSTGTNGCTTPESPAAWEKAAGSAAEDAELTRELQASVAVVEEQWASALGSAMAECKQKVARFLQDSDMWEDGLEG